MPAWARRSLRGLEGFAVLAAIWFVATLFVPERLLPGPVATAGRAIELLVRAQLGVHLAASLARIAVALLVSIVVGVPLGVFMALSPRASRLLGPSAYVLYPIPKIALLPILMLFLGLGNTAKVFLVVIIVVFQLLFAARDGVRELPASVFLSARSIHLRGVPFYRHVIVPAILPRLWSAIRLSLGISFSVIFFAESFATRFGIGFFVVNAWAQVNYPDLYAGILVLSVAGFLVFRLVDLLERSSCPWLRASSTGRPEGEPLPRG